MERIGALIRKYKLPVIGTSFDGPHVGTGRSTPAIFEDAEVWFRADSVVGWADASAWAWRGRPKPKTDEQLDAQRDLCGSHHGRCAGRHKVVAHLTTIRMR